MSAGLQERRGSSEALSDFQWRPRQGWPARQGFDLFTDITSDSRSVAIPFGQGFLRFSEPPPPWFHDLLTKITELVDLQENWDSYGARPVDSRCGAAAVKFLLSLLDPTTPKPFIVPTSSGGIQLEWHRAGADLEIEIKSPARFHVFFEDEQTGKETELTLSDNLLPLVPFLERLNATY